MIISIVFFWPNHLLQNEWWYVQFWHMQPDYEIGMVVSTLIFDWIEHFLRVILSFCLNQLIFLDIIFFYKHLEYHSNFLDLITKAIFLWNEIVIMPFWIKFWPVHNHKCFSRQVESLPKKSITIYKNGWRRLKLLRTFVQTCLNAQVPSQ